MAEKNLNGYSVMAESYRKLLAQEKKKPGMNEEELAELEAHIRVYEALAAFKENDKYLAFDSSMFNDICIGYVKAALRNIEANGSRQEREAANLLYGVLPGTINALFDTVNAEDAVQEEPICVTEYLDRLISLWSEYDSFIARNPDSPLASELKKQCERLRAIHQDVRSRNDDEIMQRFESVLEDAQALLTKARAIKTADEYSFEGGKRGLKIAIEQLPIRKSERTTLFNTLYRYGIRSLEELKETSAQDIMEMHGMGVSYVGALLNAGLIREDEEKEKEIEPAISREREFDHFLCHELGLTGAITNNIVFGTAGIFHTDYWKVGPDDFLFLSENAVRKMKGIGAVAMEKLLRVLKEKGYELGLPYEKSHDYSKMPFDTFMSHFTLSRATHKFVIQEALRRRKGVRECTVEDFLKDTHPAKISRGVLEELSVCFMTFGMDFPI